ncbi:MAG: phage holin family protein [Burkholderiaceae bacterium]|nr:phage holin family protein [Burkholderiaceae bacterium]
MLATRGELAALELQDARDRVIRWALLALVAAALLLAALLTFSLWVAAMFWDGPRGIALAVVVVVYGVAAFALMRTIRREAAVAPPLLAQTRAELAKDRAALRARPQPPADGS